MPKLTFLLTEISLLLQRNSCRSHLQQYYEVVQDWKRESPNLNKAPGEHLSSRMSDFIQKAADAGELMTLLYASAVWSVPRNLGPKSH